MRAIALAILCGCGAPHPVPTPVPVPVPASPPDAAVVAVETSQDERLAAIGKAMNELDKAIQQCWALVATERFDIEGDLTAEIAIGAAPAATHATLVVDTARTPKLSACVVALLEAYPWAPPLRGQTIRLPFRIRAPDDGQNVIDRQLVSAAGQGSVRVSVLLDENNSSNAEASMFEIQIAAGGTTGLRRAERAELWYFKTPAKIVGATSTLAIAAGDFVVVDAGGARDVQAPTEAAVDAMLVVVPGGREGAARAGALATPAVTIAPGARRPSEPRRIATASATVYPRGPGKVTIAVEPSATAKLPFAGSILAFPAGMAIPEHLHAHETELLYVLDGAGTMTVKGQPLAVGATSVVQIPAATPHAFTVTKELRAVQIYTPAGPEQRFKKP